MSKQFSSRPVPLVNPEGSPASPARGSVKANMGVLEESQARRISLGADRRAGKRRDLTIVLARAEDQERRALAKDLHDDLGQMLAVVALKVWTIKKLNTSEDLRPAIDDCAKVVAQVSDKLRSMGLQLTPPMLDQRGLAPMLSWLVQEMQWVYSTTVEFKDDGLPKIIDPVVGSILYRAVHELLFNVVRHSGGAWARLETLCGECSTVIVRVTDAGVGFDIDSLELTTTRNSSGLLVLRERLGFLGGTLSIRSSPGMGTIVTIQVPLFLVDKVDARKEAAQ